MAKITPKFLTVVLLAMTSSITHADSFGVTLRYWLADQSYPDTNLINQFVAVLSEDTTTEVPAVTLRWSPDFWGDHDILLSYFTLDPALTINVLIATGFPATLFKTETKTERTDLELLVRSRFSENLFLYYGLRSIDAEVDIEIGTVPPQRQTEISEWLLAEFGTGISVPVSENGRHSMFANALGGIGRYEVELRQSEVSTSNSETGHTLDLNFGYQYTINQTASLSLRYRYWIAYIDGDTALESKGIDLGVTFNF